MKPKMKEEKRKTFPQGCKQNVMPDGNQSLHSSFSSLFYNLKSSLLIDMKFVLEAIKITKNTLMEGVSSKCQLNFLRFKKVKSKSGQNGTSNNHFIFESLFIV